MTDQRTLRRLRAVAAALLASAVLAGCDFTGPESLPLPFNKGNGDGSMTVTVEMGNAVNLVRNSEVKVDDVTVGSVRDIAFDNWHARLTIGLEPGTRLPANVVARIGQKSLLGAEYLELEPPSDEPARGRLSDGDVVPLSRTGRYPETEEVLSATALLLNGGGLGQIREITRELNDMLGGREQDVRELIARLDRFVADLNRQRRSLEAVLDNMNGLAGTIAEQDAMVDDALDTLPSGFRVLAEERRHIVRTLAAVSDFGDVATRVMRESRSGLTGNLRDLQPVLRELADAGKALPRSLGMVTFPLAVDPIRKVARGDYINIFMNFDLTLPTLDRMWLAGTPFEGLLAGVTHLPASGPGTRSVDPFKAPLRIRPNNVDPPDGLPQPSLPALPGATTGDPAQPSGPAVSDDDTALQHLMLGGEG